MNLKLTEAEERLATLLWRVAPLPSPELVKIAECEIGWSKSTIYTILKKLCDKGVVENKNAHVSVLISGLKYRTQTTLDFLEKTYRDHPKELAAMICDLYTFAIDLAMHEFGEEYAIRERKMNEWLYGGSFDVSYSQQADADEFLIGRNIEE